MAIKTVVSMHICVLEFKNLKKMLIACQYLEACRNRFW